METHLLSSCAPLIACVESESDKSKKMLHPTSRWLTSRVVANSNREWQHPSNVSKKFPRSRQTDRYGDAHRKNVTEALFFFAFALCRWRSLCWWFFEILSFLPMLAPEKEAASGEFPRQASIKYHSFIRSLKVDAALIVYHMRNAAPSRSPSRAKITRKHNDSNERRYGLRPSVQLLLIRLHLWPEARGHCSTRS